MHKLSISDRKFVFSMPVDLWAKSIINKIIKILGFKKGPPSSMYNFTIFFNTKNMLVYLKFIHF